MDDPRDRDSEDNQNPDEYSDEYSAEPDLVGETSDLTRLEDLVDFSLETPSEDLPAPEAENEPSLVSETSSFNIDLSLENPDLEPELGEEPALSFEPAFEAELEFTPEPEPEPEPEPTPLEEIRRYSDEIAPAAALAEAAYPFTLRIEGRLRPEDREKLLDTLSKHQMGIEEAELGPMFEAGRILIPRISEFAGILLVQAMRNAPVKMTLLPSDEMPDTLAHQQFEPNHEAIYAETDAPNDSHPAECIPLSPGAREQDQELIDAVTASAALRARWVEAQESHEYQELVERLKKEIKYKAYRKGASAVMNFNITLTPLSKSSQYRITAMGAAVREKKT